VIRPERCACEAVDRRHRGNGTSREDDGARRTEATVTHRNRVRGDETATPTYEAATLGLEPFDCHGVVPVVGGLVTDACGHGRPVGRHGDRTRHARYAARLSQKVRRTHHHLGRNAAPVRAFTAHERGFDSEHVESRLGELPGHLLSARTHADHHHIDRHHRYSVICACSIRHPVLLFVFQTKPAMRSAILVFSPCTLT
jgi:hypothetical protein